MKNIDPGNMTQLSPTQLRTEMLSTISDWELQKMYNDKKREVNHYNLLEVDGGWFESYTERAKLFGIGKAVGMLKRDIESDECRKSCEKVIKFLGLELAIRKGDVKYDNLQALKNAVPIMEVIQHYVSLPSHYRRGSNIVCPFPQHKDGTPSFHIYEHTNTCRCFGCHRGGDQIAFIQEYLQCSTGEAIKTFKSFRN